MKTFDRPFTGPEKGRSGKQLSRIIRPNFPKGRPAILFSVMPLGASRLFLSSSVSGERLSRIPRGCILLIVLAVLAMLTTFLLVLREKRQAEKLEIAREHEACLALIEDQNRKLHDQQIALEEALDMARSAGRAKTTFLNSMSHDIRTPRNAIIGFSALAAKHVDDQSAVTDYLGKIHQSGEHLMSLFNNVLDMSRIESGKMALNETKENLPGILDSIAGIVRSDAAAKQLFFEIDTSDITDEDVLCDRLRLNQVLLNILSNAVKFTQPGGSISLYVRETRRADAYAHYEFRIRDNGVGMSEDYLATVFEPFTRERTSTISGVQGAGLGMAITKNIVEMMGGTICASSRRCEGSEFVVSLAFKVVGQPKAAKPLAKETPEPELTGRRILLVEDNELNREIATEILEEAGFEIDTAEDGSVAVEKVRSAAPGRYDLILMDIQMPVMNGYEATRAIRSLPDRMRADIPIVALTADAFEEDRKKAFESGMNGHIAKPIEVKKLLDTLKSLLRAA